MAEWLTYSISDLLLFSPEVYWRLAKHYLATFNLLAVLIAASYPALIYCVAKQKQFKLMLVYFALLWVWLGWQFYLRQYLTINWFAEHLGYLCMLQGVLLLFAGWHIKPPYHHNTRARYSLSAITICLLLMPILAITNEAMWSVGIVGLMPLPSAIITLLLVPLITTKWRMALMPIPLLVLLVELLTLDQLSWQLFSRY